MAAPRIGWIAVTALAASMVVALAWQYRATRHLQIEHAAVKEESRALAAARARQAKLTAEAVTPAELERLRADRTALVRMRREIEQLKSAAETKQPAAPKQPGIEPEAAVMLRVEEMRNAGRATPRAAGETFVWALQRGDVDTAASLLTFTPEAQAKMEQMLTTLPPQFRTDYGTPERLMAFVMAGNSSVAAIRFVGAMESGADIVTQLIEVERRSGGMAKDKILFRRETDGWRRLITPGTVDTLAKFLAAAPVTFHVEATRK